MTSISIGKAKLVPKSNGRIAVKPKSGGLRSAKHFVIADKNKADRREAAYRKNREAKK